MAGGARALHAAQRGRTIASFPECMELSVSLHPTAPHSQRTRRPSHSDTSLPDRTYRSGSFAASATAGAPKGTGGVEPPALADFEDFR